MCVCVCVCVCIIYIYHMYVYAIACSSTPEVGERQAGSDGDALSGGVGGEGGWQARERARAAKGVALWRRCGVVV